MAKEQQVKSKQRVAEHGEVFTAEREVNAMLDLVKSETERIESRFLEPACGTGNFLEPVLRRKLAVVAARYKRKKSDYEKYSFLAVTSIYGVELLKDNVAECVERLYGVWRERYLADLKQEPGETLCGNIRFVLSKNVLCGDALTMLAADGEPIIFSQWDFAVGDKMKRKDYRLDQLMKQEETEMTFDMLGWEIDEETGAFIPSPIREYPAVDYRKIQETETYEETI